MLSNVAPDDLKDLVRPAQPIKFKARQALFERGDASAGLYIIVTGRVRVSIQQADGTDVTLANLASGELVGELSVLDGTPRNATAVATSDGEALYVPAAEFRAWVTSHGDAAWQILGAMAERLRSTDEQLAEIALLRIETRIARRLHQLFGDASHGMPRAGTHIHLNQIELASALGATRESVNRQLSRLRSAGVIARDGNELVLLNPSALEDSAEAL
jgi:CRP-like cAMP-binding protein